MCWITFSPPMKRKLHPHHHHHHHPHFHRHHHGSSVEELVRITHDAPVPTTAYPSHPHHHKVRIITPTLPIHSDHHHHPHLHPIKLHGHGKKRAPSPPPPSPCSERVRVSFPHSHDSRRERYRTVIAEPATQEIRETTRIALREVKPQRGRLRRVAGYEVLGRDVPWSWDCVSSVDGRGGRSDKSGGGGLRYPPFGPESSWM
ncbi:hypothetical protein K469DRAFT_743824 [Zopfia rhizophila CBS 207.26]|uniref:Uncharacterized protein n=1 Tax=Zopfia rhizophila CBS 207.26 TaxID=1314779 RepID=A0A6A6EWN7_9PEZI|nr:hypothetical protein K469DRAFT_743824 [Zopfia rhizophila CBS 207.26]